MFGFIPIILGILSKRKYNLKIKKQIELKKTVKPIFAKFKEVIVNYNYTINSIHPYIIICKYEDPVTGEKHKFRSDNIWYNPSNIIEQLQIENFPVYINPANKTEYYVDTSILDDRFTKIENAIKMY